MPSSFARPYVAFDGKVTIYMLPYATMRQDMILRVLETAGVYDLDRSLSNTFLFFESRAEHIDFGVDLPVDAQTLQAYWKARTANILENFGRFQYVAATVYVTIWSAYEATHDEAVDAPAAPPDEVVVKKKQSA